MPPCQCRCKPRRGYGMCKFLYSGQVMPELLRQTALRANIVLLGRTKLRLRLHPKQYSVRMRFKRMDLDLSSGPTPRLPRTRLSIDHHYNHSLSLNSAPPLCRKHPQPKIDARLYSNHPLRRKHIHRLLSHGLLLTSSRQPSMPIRPRKRFLLICPSCCYQQQTNTLLQHAAWDHS